MAGELADTEMAESAEGDAAVSEELPFDESDVAPESDVTSQVEAPEEASAVSTVPAGEAVTEEAKQEGAKDSPDTLRTVPAEEE